MNLIGRNKNRLLEISQPSGELKSRQVLIKELHPNIKLWISMSQGIKSLNSLKTLILILVRSHPTTKETNQVKL